MFDKMKALMDMQNKMQQMKIELQSTSFEVTSSDSSVKIVMNGAQDILEVKILTELAGADKVGLEAAIKDAYNKAVKRSQQVAADKMRNITGFNIPGLT